MPMFCISIHALRVEGDLDKSMPATLKDIFLSTPSGWRATAWFSSPRLSLYSFLSTPSGWRATITTDFRTGILFEISIHALRVEGDMSWGNMILVEFISIHALRVEGDRGDGFVLEQGYNISIHALRVEGDRKASNDLLFMSDISIHALRVEGDCSRPNFRFGLSVISIHALRVEGDHAR